MTHRTCALGAVLFAMAASAGAARPTTAASETFELAPFGTLHVYAPSGVPEQVVLFVSGDGGWNLGVVPMATRLRDLGALVIGVDVRSFMRALERGSQSCAYPAGDLESLSRTVQLRRHLPSYRRPILVGYSSGATLVYAALAAAPPETFAGAVSLGFCPDLAIGKVLCRGRGLHATPRTKGKGFDLAPVANLGVPWHVLQGDIDRVCSSPDTRRYVESVAGGHLVMLPKVGHGFSVTSNWDPQYVKAYRAIAATHRPPPAPLGAAIADLPLVEVPASPEASDDRLAVILTGDGGWAEIDRSIASALARRGVPAVGWSSLSYYWTPRTPETAAADLARTLRHYLAQTGRRRALLVGYSFGADVLPFLVNRLPEELRERIAGVCLLGLSGRASFEFHVSGWLGGEGDSRYPTVPEVRRLEGVPTLCLMGSDEADSACRELPAASARVLMLPGGHHFGGDYARIATLILENTQSHVP